MSRKEGRGRSRSGRARSNSRRRKEIKIDVRDDRKKSRRDRKEKICCGYLPEILCLSFLLCVLIGGLTVWLECRGPSRKQALVISCGYLNTMNAKDSMKISGAINDGYKMKTLLKQQGFDITCLNDYRGNGEQSVENYVAAVTQTSIVEALQSLIADAKAGKIDSIWLQFNGHGSKEGIICSFDEQGKNPEYFMREMWKRVFVDKISQYPVKVVAMFDCCHSGNMMQLDCEYDASRKRWTGRGSDTPGQIICLSACQKNEVVKENNRHTVNGEERVFGDFTHDFRTLSEESNLDMDLHNLFIRLRQKGGSKTSPVHPVLTSNKSDRDLENRHFRDFF